MRVFGYSRVSTFEQSDNGSSLDSQQQQINGYCMMKGYELAEHFVERGVSGSIPLIERPEGKRLFETVSKGDVIVCAKLDRAFRSASDALAVLEEFKEQAIDLHLIDLGGSVIANGVSKMVFTILAAVAEGERDRIRERIRDAKRHMASQGLFSGGSRQFGYDKVRDGSFVRLVPNAEEQAIISKMKSMKANGASLREIGAATGQGFRNVKRILDRLEKKKGV